MKIFKRIKTYFNYNWSWLGVIFSSPFIGLKLKWYFGDISRGIPYFLPTRKWFGFNFVSLGWKTKYGDFRHEWDPMFSLVLFKKQLCIWVVPKNNVTSTIYWESWLDYKYNTDKTKSEKERVIELVTKYSQTWMTHSKEQNIIVNYYYKVLKPNYFNIIQQNEKKNID